MYQQYMNQAQASIAYLSTDELKELINDDEKLEERVNEVLKSLEEEKEIIINENRKLAEENVNKEPEIIERKGRISELRDQGKSMCESVQEKLTDLKSKKGDQTPETALAVLQTAAAESEENSEKIVTKLQEKEISIEDFLEQFMSERKLMHLRKLKAEKMVDLMRQQNSANRNRPTSGPAGLPGTTPYPPSNFYPGSGGGMPSVPYPMGPLPMPMPNMFRQHY